MKDDNQTPAATPKEVQLEQKSQELLEIGELRIKHQISKAIFAGVCSENGWKQGKSITEKEFLTAIDKFTGAPIDGMPRDTKKEKEANK